MITTPKFGNCTIDTRCLPRTLVMQGRGGCQELFYHSLDLWVSKLSSLKKGFFIDTLITWGCDLRKTNWHNQLRMISTCECLKRHHYQNHKIIVIRHILANLRIGFGILYLQYMRSMIPKLHKRERDCSDLRIMHAILGNVMHTCIYIGVLHIVIVVWVSVYHKSVYTSLLLCCTKLKSSVDVAYSAPSWTPFTIMNSLSYYKLLQVPTMERWRPPLWPPMQCTNHLHP